MNTHSRDEFLGGISSSSEEDRHMLAKSMIYNLLSIRNYRTILFVFDAFRIDDKGEFMYELLCEIEENDSRSQYEHLKQEVKQLLAFAKEHKPALYAEFFYVGSLLARWSKAHKTDTRDYFEKFPGFNPETMLLHSGEDWFRELLRQVLERAQESIVQLVFTDNFTRSLLKHYQQVLDSRIAYGSKNKHGFSEVVTMDFIFFAEVLSVLIRSEKEIVADKTKDLFVVAGHYQSFHQDAVNTVHEQALYLHFLDQKQFEDLFRSSHLFTAWSTYRDYFLSDEGEIQLRSKQWYREVAKLSELAFPKENAE